MVMRDMLMGLASAIALALGSLVAVPAVKAQPATPGNASEDRSRILLGVYDPQGEFAESSSVNIEHIFVYWQALDKQALRRTLSDAQERGRAMIVTVEPYTKAPDWRDGGEHLFADITAGLFDKEIDTLCGELTAFNGPLFVRWGHEMEDPTGRYPWARNDTEGYKAAYRYFVDACRRKIPQAAFIWSPKGEKNLARYYPGNAHVDFVGLAVWGHEAMDRDLYGGKRDFRSTFKEKYDRVVGFGKPVYIAELGVAGEEPYRNEWFKSLYEAISRPGEFNLLRGIVYFNDAEPHQWPLGYGAPDWRIKTGWFAAARNFTVATQ